MAQKHSVDLSKTSAFQEALVYLADPWRDRAQQCKVDSVLTLIFYVVDLSSK